MKGPAEYSVGWIKTSLLLWGGSAQYYSVVKVTRSRFTGVILGRNPLLDNSDNSMTSIPDGLIPDLADFHGATADPFG